MKQIICFIIWLLLPTGLALADCLPGCNCAVDLCNCAGYKHRAPSACPTVPVLLIPPPATINYQWIVRKDHWFLLKDKRQIGAYTVAEKAYYPLINGMNGPQWGTRCDPPISLPR